MKYKMHTWSPRFKPASVALLPESTLSTKIPNPFSDPPNKMKGKGASRDGFVSVISLRLALAAHAIFNSLRCPPIFCIRKNNIAIKALQNGPSAASYITFLASYSYLSFQVVLEFLQKTSHCRISLKIIEVIVHPQQYYPCYLKEAIKNYVAYNCFEQIDHVIIKQIRIPVLK